MTREGERQMHCDCCANADLGLEFKSAAMFADDEVGDVESQPATACFKTG